MEQKTNWEEFGTAVETPQELAWDATITEDSNDFEPFEPGVYMFRVDKIEKARSKGNDKNPPCNMAKVTIELSDGQRKSRTTDYILLRQDLQWKIGQYFVALGMKKKGEPFSVNFDGSINKEGFVEVEKEPYTNREGKTRYRNRIVSYLEPQSEKVVKKMEEVAAAQKGNVPF